MEIRGSARAGTTSVATEVAFLSGKRETPLWVASTVEWSASRTGVLLGLAEETAPRLGVIEIEHPESRLASPEGTAGREEEDKETAACPAVISSSEPEKSDSSSD